MFWDEEKYEAKTPEERFAKNTKLVYLLAKRMDIPESEFDDIIQEGMIGLFKAANTFSDEKNIKFATYAARCIRNEMLMYLRRIKRHQNILPLDYTLGENTDGNEICLEDTLFDSKADLEKKLEEKLELTNCIYIILNCLDLREKIFMLYTMAGYKHEQIAKMYCISRSYVSRIMKKARDKIKKAMEGNLNFQNTFDVEVFDKMYVVSYKVEDLEKANKMLADLLEECRDEKEFKYEIDDINKVIHLYFLLDTESFIILAKSVRKFEDVI